MKKTKQSLPNPAVAVLLACAVPGAGHMYLGRARRGVIILLTITALFWSGIAVGGVMTVDPQTQQWWFMAQMLTGGNGLIAWQRQKAVVQEIMRDPKGPPKLDDRLVAEGLYLAAPAETVARAYSGVAGLLNLMCIFDALMLSLLGKWGEPAKQTQMQQRKQEDAP